MCKGQCRIIVPVHLALRFCGGDDNFQRRNGKALCNNTSVRSCLIDTSDIIGSHGKQTFGIVKLIELYKGFAVLAVGIVEFQSLRNGFRQLSIHKIGNRHLNFIADIGIVGICDLDGS